MGDSSPDEVVIVETQKQKKKGGKPVKEAAEKPEAPSGKQKKRKGKKKDEDEEDIDKMLAELELEYSGGKKAEDTTAEENGIRRRNGRSRCCGSCRRSFRTPGRSC